MGGSATQKVDTSSRLARLRELMKKTEPSPVDAFVIPSEDAHFSEYPASCDERRAFISGFNGSAGCAIVTTKEAFLFTDGRYFLQAEQQLDENWKLMKQGLPDVPTWQEFLYKNLEKGSKIGIDPTIISVSDAETIKETISPLGSTLVPLAKNIVDLIWDERPAPPSNPIIALNVKYSGQSSADKIKSLREFIQQKKAAGVVVNMLDEVAWLFNLRGSDIDYNPVFLAYAVVALDSVALFVNDKQLSDEARAHLDTEVEIRPYESITSYLADIARSLQLSKDKPLILGDKASLALADAAGLENTLILRSPVTDAKAIKNSTEIEGFRQCHIRDGAALVRYFAWLEEQLNAGVVIDECQGADQLEAFRSELDLFKGLSFPTISSSGPNGAIIHYSPEPATCAIIRKDQIYLCDSGAQFLDGTTDVTRTLHFGTPTAEEKRAFTRVLQGHIAIDSLVFPTGTTGFIIDPIARRALWEDGLDYRHGTGHGVGHFLNVHEGPHGIGIRIAYNNTTLKPGMTVSNEPGYYADGKFGIRIENIVIVKVVKTPNNFGDKDYLGFEHVTICPIQTKLIELDLLTEKERKWLNAYHEETFSKLSPLIQNDTRALDWLQRECKAI